MNKHGTVRVGIDVGGTFTDLVLVDTKTNKAAFGKELTTHDDPSRSMLQGLRKILDAHSLEVSDVANLVHATTLVTNAIIERKGAKVALVTTQGFRDVLEMGNETRYELYDLSFEKPAPLVERRLRFEITERMDVNGDIVLPIDQASVVAVAEKIRASGAEAIAVCLLHGYRNPVHEKRAGKLLADLLPTLPVTLSSEIAPVIREYERSNTAAGNAYVQPVIERYLTDLEAGLQSDGFRGSINLMLSGGGLTSLENAKKQPIHLIESGPAAGAMAAGYFSRLAQTPNLISFDMGGTTAKMCLFRGGVPERSNEFEAARVQRFKKGSGLPLKVPVIDLIEIGAGGGSIARIDAMGLLKVGPESASSSPGPVCYNRGGTEPTVTDGDLLLGYLSPDYFLGGDLKLDIDAVRAAVDVKIARPLGLDPTAGAAGIHAIVNETMATAARMYLTEKGEDASHYALLAFGGAGPVHAYGLAKSLDIGRIIVPPGAGVMSALGLLTSVPACDVARSYTTNLSSVDWNIVNSLYRGMEDEVRRLLSAESLSSQAIQFTRSAEMRFVGQGFEIPAPLPNGVLAFECAAAVQEGFVKAYEARFGRRVEGIGVEALTWRLHAAIPQADIHLEFGAYTPAEDARKGFREANFDGTTAINCAVYDRAKLRPGTNISGPALIEERESTTVAGPDCSITVDNHFNLLIDICPVHGHNGTAASFS